MVDNFLFLDTNILLHCKPAKEIAWKNYVKGTYKLVIAPIVIDEIDRHKRSQKNSVAKRAKSIIRFFEDIMDNGAKDWLLIDKRPTAETFSANCLDRAEQDDCLLAALLEFTQDNPNNNTLLVSNDFGPRLKAKNLGITSIKLSGNELLAEEPDERDFKLQKLIRENNELKHRAPKVDLFFEGKTKHISFKDFQGTETYEQYLAKQMEQLKKRYPIDSTPYTMPTKEEIFYRSALDESLMHHYNRTLEEFYETYQFDYLPQLYNWKVARLLSIEFMLEIHNEGNVPAEDIDLSLHFPNGIIVKSASTFNLLPDEPVPPLKPRSLYKLTEELNELRNKIPPPGASAASKPQQLISIRNNNGYHVDLKCKYLKHHQSFRFDKLAISFETLDYMKGFEFEYRLMIANDPNLKPGKLQVNFI